MARKKMDTTEPLGNGGNGDVTWKRLSLGSLPPFLNLGIGQECQGVLTQVDQVAKPILGKGKKVIGQKIEYRYRLLLTADATGDDGSRKHAPVSFNTGSIVTLSGSGSINRAIVLACYRESGILSPVALKEAFDNEVAPDFAKVIGQEFQITRQEDGKMKRGDFAGNKVKQYDVLMRPASGKVLDLYQDHAKVTA